MDTLKVHLPLNPLDGFVELNGARLHGVTAIAFSANASRNEPTEITLKIIGEIIVDGEFQPEDILVIDRKARQ